LPDHGTTDRAETLFTGDDTAVAGSDGEMHEADRFAGCRATRPRNAGNGDGEIDVGGLQRPDGHGDRGLAADGAEGVEGRSLDAQHGALGVVRIGDEAAVDDVR